MRLTVAEAAQVPEAPHEGHLAALELRADAAARLLALTATAGVCALAGAGRPRPTRFAACFAPGDWRSVC